MAVISDEIQPEIADSGAVDRIGQRFAGLFGFHGAHAMVPGAASEIGQ